MRVVQSFLNVYFSLDIHIFFYTAIFPLNVGKKDHLTQGGRIFIYTKIETEFFTYPAFSYACRLI